MKKSSVKKYLSSLLDAKMGLSKFRSAPKMTNKLQIEPLEKRMLLSVLDFATDLFQDTEPNNVEPGQSIDINGQDEAAGITGQLDLDDVDMYNITVGENGRLELQLDITEGGDQDITSIAAADSTIYYISNNALWAQNVSGSEAAELWLSHPEIADYFGEDVSEVTVSDVAVQPDGDVVLSFADRGEFLAVDQADQSITTIVDSADIMGLTGVDSDISSFGIDGNGVIYAIDQGSESVLMLTPPEVAGDYTVSYYASRADLVDALETEVLNDVLSQETEALTTLIAEAEDDFDFIPNGFAVGSGDYAEAGYNVYYTTQMGDVEIGSTVTTMSDGTITRILVSKTDPTDVTMVPFFDPDSSTFTDGDGLDPVQVNPAAIAIDEGGDFGGQMFVGTFGLTMGDEHDGKLYTVDTDGNMTEFEITSFNDPIDGEVFTGFYDVTEIAFSYDGNFGSYLYVISENTGDIGSDIWRVSPDGTAERFVKNVDDGAISMAFSYGSDLAYGDKLYVGVFGDKGQIWAIDSDGTKELFYNFGSYFNVSSLEFAPYSNAYISPMEGQLVSSVKYQTSTYGESLIFHIPSNQSSLSYPPCWASGLDTGDVSSGDIEFDSDGDLFLVSGSEYTLTQIDYQDYFDFTLEDIQLREVSVEVDGEDVVTYTSYLQLNVTEQVRIMSLGEAGDATDIVTEVSPLVTTVEDEDAGGTHGVSFTFNSSGDMYLYVDNADTMYYCERTEIEQNNGDIEGVFEEFSGEFTDTTLYSETELIDGRIRDMVWYSGTLYGIGRNGFSYDDRLDTPPQEYDDQIVAMSDYTIYGGRWYIDTMADYTDLSQVKVTVARGDLYTETFIATYGDILNEALSNLSAGAYTVSLESITPNTAEYEMLISLGTDVQVTYQIYTDEDYPTLSGDIISFAYEGKGYTEIVVNQTPTGKIVEILSLAVYGSNGRSSLLVETDEQWQLDELILDGSFGELVFQDATVDLVTSLSGTRGKVDLLDLDHITSMETTRYSYDMIRTDSLGDEVALDSVLYFDSLDNLYVKGDIDNMQIVPEDTKNRYRKIEVSGSILNSEIYGYRLDEFLVHNAFEVDNAIESSTLDFSDSRGQIREVRIVNGDAVDFLVLAGKRLSSFTMENGNLLDSSLEVTGYRGQIDSVSLLRPDDALPVNAGNMYGSAIYATKRIKTVYITGETNVYENEDSTTPTTSSISTSYYLNSKIDRVLLGGDFTGTILSSRIKDVYVGVDEEGDRLEEGDSYDGSDFYGSIQAVLSLRTFSVTGMVDGSDVVTFATSGDMTVATSNPNIYVSSGKIKSIFVEDGIVDSYILANSKITRVLVGYEDGKRSSSHRVNDFSNLERVTFNADKLSRVYYTGDAIDVHTNKVDRLGPFRDDVDNVVVE